MRSTQDQGRFGLGLEAQQATAKQYLSAHGGAELASYTEVESGKLDSRPQLEAALLHCRQTRATSSFESGRRLAAIVFKKSIVGINREE